MDLILYIAKVQNYAKSVVDVLWPVPNDDYKTDAKCNNWFQMHIRVVIIKSLICFMRVVHCCVIEHIQLAVLKF